MKLPISTLALTLAASAMALANNLSIHNICWDASMKDKITVHATLLAPEGVTITTEKKSGFLVGDGQHPLYMNCSPEEHGITYSLSKSALGANRMSINMLINKVPEDGRIRIDDSIKLQSYHGYELSTAHQLWGYNKSESFYFADCLYQTDVKQVNRSGYTLSIQAQDVDPSLSCYRVQNAEGTQIAQLPAGKAVTTFTLRDRPSSITLMRRKDEQAIHVPIKQDILLKYPYPLIAKKLMTLNLVPKAAPEQQLSEQEQALLKELRFFTMKSWALIGIKEHKPQLALVFESPEMKETSFTLLTPQLKDGAFKLAKSKDSNITGNSKYIGWYINDEKTNQSSIIIKYRESEDWDISQQQGNFVIECSEAENLVLDEQLDMRLAYGEENSKRQPLQMNEGGVLYLGGHAYRYQVNAAEPDSSACTITVSSDKKDGLPPRLHFYDAQGKAIAPHSSQGHSWDWSGNFNTLPHAIQVSKEAGILPIKADLKINLPMPQNF